MERMSFFILPAKYVLKTHSPCKLIEVLQKLASNKIIICNGSRNKFESFRHKANLVVCQFFIREVFDVFLFASKVSFVRSMRSRFLRSFRFLFAIFGLLVTP